MATLYSSQWTNAFVSVPSVKIAPGDVGGEVKMAYAEFVVTAAPTNGDVLKLFKLPSGARLVEFVLSFPDLGTAGSLNVGWAANGVDAADADGILAAVDVNTAADTVLMTSGANLPGFGKEFGAETDIQIDIATAWTATTGTIKALAKYVTI